MDTYWSVIAGIAGVGVALTAALTIAAALLLGPTLGGRALLRRRKAGAEAAMAPVPAAIGAADSAGRTRSTTAPRPITRAA